MSSQDVKTAIAAEKQKVEKLNADKAAADKKAPKVKMTDVMLAFIMNSPLISEEAKNQFNSEFNKVVEKATSPSVRKQMEAQVLELIKKANPIVGISGNEIRLAIENDYPTINTFDLDNRLYFILQQATADKLKWPVTIVKCVGYPVPAK